MFFQFILSLIRVSEGKSKVKKECVKMSVNSDLLLDQILSSGIKILQGINHDEVGDQIDYR